MKRSVLTLAMAFAVASATALGASPAAAWNCPVQIKSAEDTIKKAEAMKLTPEGRDLIDKAKKLVAEAKENHSNARTKVEHANAMWKAKAAQAQGASGNG